MSRGQDTIVSFLEAEIERGAFPGAQYALSQDSHLVAEGEAGHAVVDPEKIAVSSDTIYDIASLTKPLVTSLLVMMLVERGQLRLDDQLSDYLPELRKTKNQAPFAGLGSATLRQLLTHTSGLLNWLPLYLETSESSGALAAIELNGICSTPEDAPVVYSDLGYILLGYVLERVSGSPLDQLAKQEIFDNLKLSRTMFNPPRKLQRQIAATERGQTFERNNAYLTEQQLARQRSIVGENGAAAAAESMLVETDLPTVPFRTEMIWGEVHDGNAYFLGGVAGHAGLFSTARETCIIANQFLSGSRLLSPESIDLFQKNQTKGRGTDRSIGWVLATTSECSAGPDLPRNSFGHTGFTGTSIWIDPVKCRVFVLLTNRVHPRVGIIDMKESRQRFNSLAVESLG